MKLFEIIETVELALAAGDLSDVEDALAIVRAERLDNIRLGARLRPGSRKHSERRDRACILSRHADRLIARITELKEAA